MSQNFAIAHLTALALRQRLLVLVLTFGLIGAGVWAYLRLPIDAFPDVSSTQVKIILKVPGLTPQEVEQRVTSLVEQEMLGIPNKTMLRSLSHYALSDVTIDFEEGTDIYWARQQVNERLSVVLSSLPPTAEGGLAPITTPLGEMYMFTIEGPQTLAERRTQLDWVIRPALRAIPGVADVNALGGVVRTFNIAPNFSALAASQITVEKLIEAIQNNNQNDGAGRVARQGESILVRTEGRIKTLEDLRNIVVGRSGDQLLRVRQLADISIEGLTRYGAVTENGQGETVEGLVLGLRGANARQVVEMVEQKLKALETGLPEGMSIKPFYNRGHLVDRALGTVSKALLEATVLVLITLYLFLGNVRSALVVAIILPLSALATFLCMHWAHLSANLMSLGGLAIAIGMLVDASVVVVENVQARQAHELDNNPQGASSSVLALVQEATAEVALPITSGILIIMTVFLPLLTLEGLEGKLFSPVALTIVFALGCSLLLSLTVIPALCSVLSVSSDPAAHQTPRMVQFLERHYTRLLAACMQRPVLVYGVAVASLLAALVLLAFIGKSFIPQLDEGDIIMQTEKLPSISLEEAIDIDLRMEQAILKAVPEVERIVARLGADEIGLDPMGLSDSDVFMVLKPHAQWRFAEKSQLVDAIRTAVSGFSGMNIGFSQPIEMRTNEMLSGVRGDLALKIFGPDLQTLKALTEKSLALLESIKGAQDVQTTKSDGLEYVQVKLDPAALGLVGLDAKTAQNMLRHLVEGTRIGEVLEGNRRTPLVVRLNNANEYDLENIRLPLADNHWVPLSSVARLEKEVGPTRIARENSVRSMVVRANVRDRDLVGFVEEAKQSFAQQITLPPGYSVTWGGQFENQQRAAKRLMWVIPIALALILVILQLTLGKVAQAVLVLVNIPFAIVGGIFALGIAGEYLSVPAAVGFIALMGIAVLNGLVLLTEFNTLAQLGMKGDALVQHGALRRLRPVLMTAAITALGLIPLLFATGPGSEIQRPLAVVVIGGLLSSTLLTLILMPMLFRRFIGDEEKS